MSHLHARTSLLYRLIPKYCCNLDNVLAEADVFVHFLQDPTDLHKFNLASFHHLKNNLTVVDEGEFVLN